LFKIKVLKVLKVPLCTLCYGQSERRAPSWAVASHGHGRFDTARSLLLRPRVLTRFWLKCPRCKSQTLEFLFLGLVINLSNDSLSPSPTSYKYDYMSKNLCMRLTKPSSGLTPPGLTPPGLTVTHSGLTESSADLGLGGHHRADLFEIDRKRKFLLEEVETIQKRKYEELDTLKKIEVRKDGLLKELVSAQEAIEKQRAFMKQLESEIITKSRQVKFPSNNSDEIS
jgi:hypothetical protein